MNAIVVFQSKYGSTEKYSQWIAEALHCSAKKLEDIQPGELAGYDTLLYGGGLYAGSINGLKKFLKLLGSAEGKRLGLFMVGMTDPAQKEVYEEAAARNIPGAWKACFAVFALRGDHRYSKMSGPHKLMMRMMQAASKTAAAPPEAATSSTVAFCQDAALSSMEQIDPIVKHFCGCSNGGSQG